MPTTYTALRQQRPELFTNHPDGIKILPPTPTHGIAYQDQFIILIRDRVEFPDGTEGSYNRLVSADLVPGCAILPILEGNIILIEHYRHSTRQWHLEIPRGCGAPATTPEESAIRELAEEIGVTAHRMWELGAVHPDTGILAGEPVQLYAAEIRSIGQIDGHEGIRRALTVSAPEVEAMAADGQITDGFTLAALYRARLLGVLPS